MRELTLLALMAVFAVMALAPAMNVSARKVGGITFLRVGQFGCSFYVTRKPFA